MKGISSIIGTVLLITVVITISAILSFTLNNLVTNQQSQKLTANVYVDDKKDDSVTFKLVNPKTATKVVIEKPDDNTVELTTIGDSITFSQTGRYIITAKNSNNEKFLKAFKNS